MASCRASAFSFFASAWDYCFWVASAASCCIRPLVRAAPIPSRISLACSTSPSTNDVNINYVVTGVARLPIARANAPAIIIPWLASLSIASARRHVAIPAATTPTARVGAPCACQPAHNQLTKAVPCTVAHAITIAGNSIQAVSRDMKVFGIFIIFFIKYLVLKFKFFNKNDEKWKEKKQNGFF